MVRMTNSRQRSKRTNNNNTGDSGYSPALIPQMSMITGRPLRPSQRPPTFNAVPWNTATVVFIEANFSAKTYTGLTICTAASSQLGLYTTTSGSTTETPIVLDLMVLSVCAWVYPKDTGPNTLTLQPLNPLTGSEFINVSATASGSTVGSVGFMFPSYNSAPTTTSEIKTMKYATINASGSPQVEVHFKIKWRGAKSKSLALLYVHVPNYRQNTVHPEHEASMYEETFHRVSVSAADDDDSVSVIPAPTFDEVELLRRFRHLLNQS